MTYWSYLQRTLRALRNDQQPALICTMYMDKLFELIGVENHKYFTSNFAMKHNTLGHNDISYEDDSLTQEVGKVALQVCVTTGPGQAAGQVHYHKH